MVGQPAARPDANLESLWKSEQGSTPEPYIFLKLDDKPRLERQGGSNAGSIMDGAWCMLEQQETFYFFFCKLYERSMGGILLGFTYLS